MKDAEALSPDLSRIRILFYACHDSQGGQIGWPKGGGVQDQDAEIVYAFMRMRTWIAERSATAKKNQEGAARKTRGVRDG